MYTINYEKVCASIRAQHAKRILIQLPDGLKNKTLEIQEIIKKEFPHIEILFWSGSNFGACDLPTGIEKLGVDMLLHFGHTEWVY